MGQLDVEWEIIFADDSDDQTPEIVEKLAREGVAVRCAHREPNERNNSISGAINLALESVSASVGVVIDCDLQHPPEILPALIRPLLAGSVDFSVGSRYTMHGSAAGLGSKWRQSASRASARFTGIVLPQFAPISDLASGLFAFQIDAFRRGSAPSTGFKVLPEALVRCNPGRVVDVPYSFETRFDGLSKARLRDGIRLAQALLALRLSTARLRRVRMVPYADTAR